MIISLFISVGLIFLFWHAFKSLILLDLQQDLHDRIPYCDKSMLKKREEYKSKQSMSGQHKWRDRTWRVGRRLFAPRIRVFVSYQNADKKFATRLAITLETSWAPSFFHVDPSIIGLSFPWTKSGIKALPLDTNAVLPETRDLFHRIGATMGP